MFFRLKNFSLIFIGALVGGLLRWGLDNDLASNIIGATLLGIFFSIDLNRDFKLLLGIGLCGSLTTFSGWLLRMFSFFTAGDISEAILLFISTLLCGLLSASLGIWLGKRINQIRLSL